MNKDEKISRWYLEPWAWVVVVLLVVTLAASVGTLLLAIRNRPAELNPQWYQKGIMVNQLIRENQAIKNLHLKAKLKIDKLTGEIFLLLTQSHKSQNKKVDPKRLTLYIEHPALSQFDQHIILKRIGKDRYYGQLQRELHGQRYLLLMPQTKSWRLKAEASFPTTHDTILG